MSEGVTISHDRIHLAFESGASHYANNEDGDGVPDRVIRDLQSTHRDLLPFSP